MEEFRKDDVLTLYNAFIKLCDFIECEVECGKCPLWENICSQPNGYQCDEFAESLKRIRETLGTEDRDRIS